MNIDITHHSFHSVRDRWNSILPHCSINTLFITPIWNQLWWDATIHQEEPLLIEFHQNEQTIGIAPLMRQQDSIALMGDPDLFDYQDFIVLEDAEQTFFTSLLDFLDDEPWNELTFPSLREDSKTLSFIPELANKKGWHCKVEVQDVAPGVTLPTNWDSYLTNLDKKNRHELRRKFRRLTTTVATNTTICFTPNEIQTCMEDLFTLMRKGRDAKRQFLTEDHETFFRDIASGLSNLGILTLHFLEIEKERVASCLCFDYNGQRLLYNSGFNPKYSNLSVGLLLKASCLDNSISNGLDYFDFLKGDEQYKYHLGGVNRFIYKISISR